MAIDVESPELAVGVVGAGTMGRGIAQVAAQGGMRVLLHDNQPGAAERGREQVLAMLRRAVERGRLDRAEADAAAGRLRIVDNLDDIGACAAVIEAVAEDLEIKRRLFRELEAAVAPDAILASNTSSIPIASIAAACRRRERIAGMHFFNPVPLMPLVEVIGAPATAPEVLSNLVALSKRMGRVPVVVRDSPGFLVNLGGRAFTTEALRILSEGAATPGQIDALMRDCLGFRMGPFELMDLTGMDVNFPVSRIIYEGYFHDRRLATSPRHQAMAESGRLGRKTGAGWYDYDAEGQRLPDPAAEVEPPAAAAPSVLLAEPDERLRRLFAEAGAAICPADDRVSPIVAAPLGEDCTALAVRLGLDPARLVALDLTGGGARRLTVMSAPGADPAARDAVAARLAQGGRAVSRIRDCPGFVVQRIAAMVANLGCEMAQIGIAAPADIDTAMTLGLSYPQGPLELAAKLGPETVYTVLLKLQEITGDDRYRPSQWLRRRALLRLPIHTPD